MADKTWLFVPAKEKFLKNFEKIEADYVILDLEDSLKEEQKDDGLALAVKILQKYGKTRSIYVRVNSGKRMERELRILQKYDFSGFMIPKFENVEILEEFRDYTGQKEIIALIETVKGIIELPQIASSSFVHKLAFGAEDFCRELGFEAGEEATFFPRNQMVLYGSYYHKYVLDGVCLDVHNMDIFKESYQKTKRMGFHGKLLIHPNQVKAVQEYNDCLDVERLKYIVKTFKNSGEGVLFIDGEFYEKPLIDKIENYLEEIMELKHCSCEGIE